MSLFRTLLKYAMAEERGEQAPQPAPAATPKRPSTYEELEQRDRDVWERYWNNLTPEQKEHERRVRTKHDELTRERYGGGALRPWERESLERHKAGPASANATAKQLYMLALMKMRGGYNAR